MEIKGFRKLTRKKYIMAPKMFEAENYMMFKIKGDSLSGKNVPDGSVLIFDVNMTPKNGDITLCSMVGGIRCHVYFRRCTAGFVVRTEFGNETAEVQFLAKDVMGVAVACVYKGCYRPIRM